MDNRGLIEVYTGEGRGKTSCAFGLLVRALGHDMSPLWISYFKGGDNFERGIQNMLTRLEVPWWNYVPSHPSFGATEKEQANKECLESLQKLSDWFQKDYNPIILDELIVALRDGFISRGDFEPLLDEKPDQLNLLLTGRGAPSWLIERADLVSNIHSVKHPYEEGIGARPGLDY